MGLDFVKMGTTIWFTMAALRNSLSYANKSIFKQGIKVASSCPASPCHQKQPARNLSVHEHVSMSLLRDAGVPTPKFGLATTAAEAKQIAEDLDTKDLVIKLRFWQVAVARAIFPSTQRVVFNF